MKIFITITLLIALSAVVMCNEKDPEMKKNIEECIKENNVSAQEFQDFMHGKVTAPSENLKCSSLCVWTKQGLMDASGKFNEDAAKAKMAGDAKFAAAVDECKNESGSSACDTAMKISQCIIKHKSM